MKRAPTYEDIRPLVDLCKNGHLFEVQDWIRSGKPVNPPPPPKKGARPRSPLQYAIEFGFHSLVQVLVEGGAEIECGWKYCALTHALRKNRFNIVQLLVEHGADIKSVDMYEVFSTWQPNIMEYFIERGADVEEGNPLAQALCSKIRTALGIFKKYKSRFPSFQRQINIALRHHCKEGSLKWISLLLWAGADPYAPGPDTPESDSEEDDDGISALEYAALYGHHEIFAMKQVRIDPKHPVLASVLNYAHGDNASVLISELLAKGVNPNDQPNGGCSVIQSFVSGLGWSYNPFSDVEKRNIDTSESREKIKGIHILAKHGARWIPEDNSQIRHARGSLLRMIPDYTGEFVWIMSKYRACDRRSLEALLRTPTIRRHASSCWHRIQELVEKLGVSDSVSAASV